MVMNEGVCLTLTLTITLTLTLTHGALTLTHGDDQDGDEHGDE